MATMSGRIWRAFGVVPVAVVRKMIEVHNAQRAADDAVYREQSEEIRRLGALLARSEQRALEIDLQRIREHTDAENRHATMVARMGAQIADAEALRLRENRRWQGLVDEANTLRLSERRDLEARGGGIAWTSIWT